MCVNLSTLSLSLIIKLTSFSFCYWHPFFFKLLVWYYYYYYYLCIWSRERIVEMSIYTHIEMGYTIFGHMGNGRRAIRDFNPCWLNVDKIIFHVRILLNFSCQSLIYVVGIEIKIDGAFLVSTPSSEHLY